MLRHSVDPPQQPPLERQDESASSVRPVVSQVIGGQAVRERAWIMSDVRRNLELKARLTHLAETRRRVQQVATQPPTHLKQVDTYFHCRTGRLKLRETVGRPAQLIWYDRPDRDEVRASRYILSEVVDADAIRELLTLALGVRAVVRKRREVYLYRCVRIHLDQVEGLGDFLELEAVLDGSGDEMEAERVLADLRDRLDVPQHNLVAQSYVDLV